MVLCTFCAADLTNKGKLKREHFLYFDLGFFNGFAFGEPRYPLSAIHAIERVFRLATRVNVVANTPSRPPAVFAWVRRVIDFIFP